MLMRIIVQHWRARLLAQIRIDGRFERRQNQLVAAEAR
jgi:hypothetical protein